MDFDTGQRDNLGLYSKLFEEIQYIPQMDHYEGFSSSPSSHISAGRVFLNPNLDHHHNTSWNSGLFYAPNSSFYDPFDPFQPSFGQDDDNNVSALNSHVLKTFLDDGGQDSRASFQTMDDQYNTMNVIEPLDYPRTAAATMSGYSPSYNAKYFDKDSCFVFGDVDGDVDNDDGDVANRKTSIDVKNKITQAKRKRVVDKKSEIVKGQWSPEEDGLLVELVEKHGVRKWSMIAQMLPGRIGKQCRERWHNHLKPNIKKDRWSEEEDKILIEAHRQLGNKWAEIARSLPGRSENTIKNHWNATKRRQLSSRKNNNSKTNSPLQNYIKTVISTSDDKGNLDNSSSSSSASASASASASTSPDGTANPKPVDNFSEMMKTEKAAVSAVAAAEESFTLLPIISAMGTDHMHMNFDLQKEMDFMEMLSYNGYYI